MKHWEKVKTAEEAADYLIPLEAIIIKSLEEKQDKFFLEIKNYIKDNKDINKYIKAEVIFGIKWKIECYKTFLLYRLWEIHYCQMRSILGEEEWHKLTSKFTSSLSEYTIENSIPRNIPTYIHMLEYKERRSKTLSK